MRKLFSILTAFALLFTLTAPASAEQATKSDDIVILYTNDVHTYIDKALRYDAIAGLKATLEAQYETVLLVDAGDHIQGTAYGSMDNGKTIVDLMNAAGYDLATLGNHEFDYGMAGCMNAIEWAQFPYISCNFYHESGGVREDNVLDSYQIFPCGEAKIAFVGITTPETIIKSTPAYFQDDEGNFIYGIAGGSDGEALYANVQQAIDEVQKAGATTVIALGHLGVDPSSHPWTSEDVIANVSGLDAFIDGHSHSTVEGKIVSDESGANVLLTQTGQYFDRIGMMVIDSETGDITTKLLTAEDLPDATPNRDVKGMLDNWINQIDAQLGQVIGSTLVTLSNYDAEGNRLVRKQETNSGDFCTDALYYLFDSLDMDVDVAVMNGGGIRNDAITGDISYLICKNIHPFGNVVCLQTVTGQQILDALEWSARMAGSPEENGSFLHVSGLTFRIDTSIPFTVQYDSNEIWTSGPTGAYRVHDVMVYNKETNLWDPLDLDANYNLAGHNYTLRELGGGYAMFDGAVNVLDYVMEDYMVLAHYIQAFENSVVTAGTSPLSLKYPGFKVDYSTVYGSGRIVMEPAQEYEVMCSGTAADSCPSLSYRDLDTSAWYHPAVDYALRAGLMSGCGENIFSPEGHTTRAMLAVMLWRLSGSPVIGSTQNFKDVGDGLWYTQAIRWAKSAGIAAGYEDGRFGPNDLLTREQLVTILWQYARYIGCDVSVGEEANILSYDDAFTISEYAVPAFQWACGAGITEGNKIDGIRNLDPRLPSTRAQTADMLMRLHLITP